MPESPALLYRALIAQSARWPKNINEVSKEECVSTLRHIGYGVPDVERATHNDEYRITLVTPSLMELGDDEAHIFKFLFLRNYLTLVKIMTFWSKLLCPMQRILAGLGVT